MKWIVLTEQTRNAIIAENAVQIGKQVMPIQLTDGRWIVYSDILSDTYWSDYHSILEGLTQEDVDDSLFVKAEIPQ